MLLYFPSEFFRTLSISNAPPKILRFAVFDSSVVCDVVYSELIALNSAVAGSFFCTYEYVRVLPPVGETQLSNGNNCKISDSRRNVSTTRSATLSDIPTFISANVIAIVFHLFNLSYFSSNFIRIASARFFGSVAPPSWF